MAHYKAKISFFKGNPIAKYIVETNDKKIFRVVDIAEQGRNYKKEDFNYFKLLRKIRM